MSIRSPLLIPLMGLLLAACLSSVQGGAPAGAEPASGVLLNGTAGRYTNIAPAPLAAMLEHKDFLLINTHVPYEGEIAETDVFIAYEAAGPQRVGDYPADKSTRIVLYCRSGRMSAIVAQELVQAGYTNVWNLEGGMIAWEQAGYEVLQKK